MLVRVAQRVQTPPPTNPTQGELMAQTVKHLPQKSEDFSLMFRTYVKKLGVVACAWNPRAGEVETGRFLGLAGQPV